jgi:hypothetical protein
MVDMVDIMEDIPLLEGGSYLRYFNNPCGLIRG